MGPNLQEVGTPRRVLRIWRLNTTQKVHLMHAVRPFLPPRWVFVFAILLSCALAPHEAQAQFSKEINSDRPGVSNGAKTVGTYMFQLQSGLTSFGKDAPNGVQWNTVFRIGLGNKTECRLGSTLNTKANGDGQIWIRTSEMGLRRNLVSRRNSPVAIGIQSNLTLGHTSPDDGFDLGANALLAGEFSLGDASSLTVNLAGDYAKDQDLAYRYTANFSHRISPDFMLFAEAYGPLQGFEISSDAGLAFNPSENLQIDISFGLDPELDFNFIDGGVSWRIAGR